jgi:hypothetical protein
MTKYPAILRPACNWYITFLELKIQETWKTLFQPILLNIDTTADEPNDGDIILAFKILSFVARTLKRRDLALSDIVDGLYNEEYFNDGIDGDDDRSVAHQLVFSIIGWISECFPDHYRLKNANPCAHKVSCIPHIHIREAIFWKLLMELGPQLQRGLVALARLCPFDVIFSIDRGRLLITDKTWRIMINLSIYF